MREGRGGEERREGGKEREGRERRGGEMGRREGRKGERREGREGESYYCYVLTTSRYCQVLKTGLTCFLCSYNTDRYSTD